MRNVTCTKSANTTQGREQVNALALIYKKRNGPDSSTCSRPFPYRDNCFPKALSMNIGTYILTFEHFFQIAHHIHIEYIYRQIIFTTHRYC